MEYVQNIVDEYFENHPINVKVVKTNYEKRNRVKLIDDSTANAFTIGVNADKLYIEKLMMK